MNSVELLQSRIEQLEAKLGITPVITYENDEDTHQHVYQQQGDMGQSITENLMNTANVIQTAMSGQEKLNEATLRASELNNYMDPKFMENMQQADVKAQVVEASEAQLRHHCNCMHHCQQAASVLNSEPIQHVPQMQEPLEQLQSAAEIIKAQSEEVVQGVQQVAETCGTASAEASASVMKIAKKVESVESAQNVKPVSSSMPKRRNGLD